MAKRLLICELKKFNKKLKLWYHAFKQKTKDEKRLLEQKQRRFEKEN